MKVHFQKQISTALEHLVYETEEAMTRRLQELARIAQDSPELDERRAATEQLLI